MTNKLVLLTLLMLLVLGGCSDKVADSDKSNVTIAFKTELSSQSSYFETSQFLLSVYLPEEDKYITLKISASALRTVDKKGISACVKEARAKGYLRV